MTESSNFVDVWLETDSGHRQPLGRVCRIGRDPECDVVIKGEKVSRQHAIINAQDESEYWLIDLGSTNATFLNGQRVLHPVRLHDGDCLTIVGSVFRFRQPGDGPSGTTVLGTGNATVIDLQKRDAWLLIVDIERFTQLTHELAPDRLAVEVGTWIKKGQRLVEKAGGRISKFLGDGFLACWESTEGSTPTLVATLEGFRLLRQAGPVKFRVVVHHGGVTFGTAVQFGEENMMGTELPYIFRLEKLAAELGVDFCVSEAARDRLQGHLQMEPLPGEHVLKGIPGQHRCYRILWPER